MKIKSKNKETSEDKLAVLPKEDLDLYHLTDCWLYNALKKKIDAYKERGQLDDYTDFLLGKDIYDDSLWKYVTEKKLITKKDSEDPVYTRTIYNKEDVNKIEKRWLRSQLNQKVREHRYYADLNEYLKVLKELNERCFTITFDKILEDDERENFELFESASNNK